MTKFAYIKTIIISLFLFLSGLWILSGVPDSAEGISGNIDSNTTWSGNVDVTGNIYVQDGIRLTVNAGANVEFRGPYGIYLAPNASIIVKGTSGNLVTFYNNTFNGWQGITLNASSCTAVIEYAHFYNGWEVIKATSGGYLILNNSIINHSFAAIQGNNMNPIIYNNYIHNNSVPIFFQNNVNGIVTHNRFVNNSGAVLWGMSIGQPKFDNNVILDTGDVASSNGVEFQNSNPHFTNNTIRNSTGNGAYFKHCSGYIYNNTILENGIPGSEAGIKLHAPLFKESSTVDNNRIYNNGVGIILDMDPTESGANISSEIRNNEIFNNVKSGVQIGNYSFPDFHDNNIYGNKWGVKVHNATPYIVSSTVINNTEYDYYVQENAMPTSLDTYFNTTYVVITAGDQYLAVKWYLHVKVLEKVTFVPVSNIGIYIYSNVNLSKPVIRHARLTDTLGYTSNIPVLEKVIRNSLITNFTPHDIYAEDTRIPKAYVDNSILNHSILNSKTLTIILDRNFAPSLPTGLGPLVTHDTSPLISWSLSVDPNLDPVTYYIKVGTTFGGQEEVPVTPVPSVLYYDLGHDLKYGVTYSVSVKAGDNNYANSTWAHMNMTIYDNPPSMPIMSIEPSRIVTNKDIYVNMTSPSTDITYEVNDFGENIRYCVYVDINELRQSQYTKLYVPAYQVNFKIKKDDFNKGDKINISVIPYNGHEAGWNTSGPSGAFAHPDNGTPAFITLIINNSAPRINHSIADVHMDEDTTYTLPYTFNQLFTDPDLDVMQFDYIENPNYDILYIPSTDEINIKPKQDYFTVGGVFDQIILQADDGSSGLTEITINVNVREINDLPLINVIEPQIAYQDQPHTIDIVITDPADPHDSSSLSVSTNYDTLPLNLTLESHGADSITLSLTPNNDEVGKFNLTITASDGKDAKVKILAIEVRNVNDPPEVPIITKPLLGPDGKSEQRYFVTDEIFFEAVVSDPDIKHGDSLNIYWESNISGVNFEDNKFKFTTKINIEGIHKITVTVEDDFMETASTSFILTEVIDEFTKPKPLTELITPKNSQPVPTTSSTVQVSLIWKPIDHTYSELFKYDVYMGESENTNNKIASNVQGTQYLVNAQVGKTYYWKVIPKLGSVEGECFSGEWSFEIIPYNGIPPKIDLVTPDDGETINSSSVEFTWSSDDEYAWSYFYKVYIDTNPNPTTFVGNAYTMSYIYDKLVDGETYYWNVEPFFGNFSGKSNNGPLMFKVDSKYIPEPGVTISPDIYEYKMNPNGKLDLVYTVENTGNTIETVTITITPDTILEGAFEKNFDVITIRLEPGERQEVKFTVDLSNVDIGTGDYNIRLKVLSGDKDVSERVDIKLDVVSDKDDEKSGFGIQHAIMVIIVIIIVVCAVLFYILRPRKKQFYDGYKVDEGTTKISSESSDEKAKEDEWEEYYSK